MMSSSDGGWSNDLAVRRMAEEIRSTDIFQMLDAEEAMHVAGICSRHLLGPGDTLFHEGQAARNLYLVLRGELQVIVRSPDGEAEVVVGRIQPGNLVGEMAVLEAVPRSATARAFRPCELLVMPGRKFAELVASGHQGAFAILRQLQGTLSDRMRELHVRVDAVMDGGDGVPQTGAEEVQPLTTPEPTLWHLIDESESAHRDGGASDSDQ